MPNWNEYVREHLSLPKCSPEREAEIIEELAQQFDDAYEEGLLSGLSEQGALLAAKRHVSDWSAFADDLMQAGFGHPRKPANHNFTDNTEPAFGRIRQFVSAPLSDLNPDRRQFKTRVATVIEMTGQDLHYAIRMLAKRPLFTFVAVVTLAIGIGANTAIFSVIDSVLLRPLPYPQGNRLTVLWSTLGKEGRCPGSGPELLSLRERSKLFDQFAGIWVQNGALTGQGEPQQVKLGWVTANFLSLLSAHPQAGRFFIPQDEGKGRAPVVVISHELWQRHYGSDPNLVGRSILLSGRPYTVVGILPAGFKLMFPEGASVPANIDVYASFDMNLAEQPRDQDFIRIIGRLRDGVTIQQAQGELDANTPGKADPCHS